MHGAAGAQREARRRADAGGELHRHRRGRVLADGPARSHRRVERADSFRSAATPRDSPGASASSSTNDRVFLDDSRRGAPSSEFDLRTRRVARGRSARASTRRDRPSGRAEARVLAVETRSSTTRYERPARTGRDDSCIDEAGLGEHHRTLAHSRIRAFARRRDRSTRALGTRHSVRNPTRLRRAGRLSLARVSLPGSKRRPRATPASATRVACVPPTPPNAILSFSSAATSIIRGPRVCRRRP